MKKFYLGRAALMTTSTAVLLAACATGAPPATGTQYRCEQGVEFKVKYVDNTAILDSSKGTDLLYRDAGGQGPQQTVYANRRLRAEFGLGASGREAVLRYSMPPLVVRCIRD